jgi:phage terminase small subunit
MSRDLKKNEHGLTSKQTALVEHLVANGGTIKEAAEVAGYSVGESGRVSASKALALPHVQAYMMQRIRDELGVKATSALHRVMHLSSSAKSEYVQLEASKDLLDRAGLKAPDKHMHLHAGDIKVEIDLG